MSVSAQTGGHRLELESWLGHTKDFITIQTYSFPNDKINERVLIHLYIEMLVLFLCFEDCVCLLDFESTLSFLFRPFGGVAELLTAHVVQVYFVPIRKIIINCLGSLTDDELKKESSKSEQRIDTLSAMIKFLRRLMSRLPTIEAEKEICDLEMFRLKMILRFVFC